MRATAAPTLSTSTSGKDSHHRVRPLFFLCVLRVLCGGTIPESKLVDLTHPFNESTVYWPTAQPFQWEKESWGPSPAGYWYAAGRFRLSEHVGTHLDSPIHFAESRHTTDQIPLRQLVGPALRIDVSSQDPNYQVTAEDLLAFEKRHRRIPPGAIVLIHTGWSRFWPDRKRYLGSDTPGDTSNLHFPGLSKAAADLLVSRQVDAVGIDTASLDPGSSRDYPVHRALNAANIYGLENVANLERVPNRGATLIALPMLIQGSSGAPVRIIAILP